MKMLFTAITKHEIRDVVRDGRFRWSAAIVAGLLLAALLVGWSQQRRVAAEHASAERLSRDTWLSQAAKDPHSAAHYGAYVFKPRGPLTLFDSGVNAYTGVAVWLEAHKQNEFQFRPAQDGTSIGRLGHLTAAATLQLLIPVLIVLLAFTKFAGEREDGTLRQVLAQGVSPATLAAGKAAGIAAALAFVVVPAAIVGAFALIWSAGFSPMRDDGARVALLAVIYCAYFAVFVALGLAGSAVLRKSSHALGLLIAFWVLNAVLVPRTAADQSRRLYPTPTAFEFAQTVEHDTYDGLPVHVYNVKRAADLRNRLLDEYKVSRIEDLPVNFRGIDYLEREVHSNSVWEKHYRRLWEAFEHQTNIHQVAGFAAPLLAVRSLSMALTGVDFFHHRHFAAEAETYRHRLVLTMNSDLAYGAGSHKLGAYVTDPALWSKVQAFEYRAPDLAWALHGVTVSVLALGTWLAIALTMLIASIRQVGVE
jgi:ABC-2 type transport system permease protein